MTQNNNLSVLPFYTNIDQQNHRKSYAFGAIYPLFAPANILLPFQIMRATRKEYGKGTRLYGESDRGYLNEMGEWMTRQDTCVTEIEVTDRIYFESMPMPIGVMAVAYNEELEVLGVFNPDFSDRFSGLWELPEGTTIVRAQTSDNNITGYIYTAILQPTTIKICELFDKNGIQTQDITQNIIEVGLQIVPFDNWGYDIIVFPATLPMPIRMQDGIYYMTISDGVQTWFSEMFTVVQDMTPYLKIEWWDVENFVFDAGQIVYRNPLFRNRLYFCAEVGKPEYQFEEEGENRNGYYFPEKQISEKTYKFTILAPEYLCDVMRFIRMADFVKVTDKYEREYDVDTFLITPKWQTQGDLASVEVEFETNTVAKKIGRGLIVQARGDFNNDFNNDFKNQE